MTEEKKWDRKRPMGSEKNGPCVLVSATQGGRSEGQRQKKGGEREAKRNRRGVFLTKTRSRCQKARREREK